GVATSAQAETPRRLYRLAWPGQDQGRGSFRPRRATYLLGTERFSPQAPVLEAQINCGAVRSVRGVAPQAWLPPRRRKLPERLYRLAWPSPRHGNGSFRPQRAPSLRYPPKRHWELPVTPNGGWHCVAGLPAVHGVTP